MTRIRFSTHGLAGLVGLFLGGLTISSTARAAVTEPNGLVIPAPLTATEVMVAASTNPLFPVVSLDVLFQARGEAVNWQTDAQKKPDTFSPACGFEAELVLRGGGCRIDFGWYNVVPGQTPTDAQIFPLITAAQIMALPLEAFQPGAGERIPGLRFQATTILTDPNYAGGLIGFATRGRTGTFCTQTHYSQQSLNQLCTNCTQSTDGDNHWIASVIYKSTRDPNGYYIAFEDLPTSPTSFAGDGQYKNDGDMNDFVFFVSGVTCPGGGRPCDTGKQGFCKQGVSQCESGGLLSCRQSFQPNPDKCDNIDNDCNGVVDDGTPEVLCPPAKTCLQGKCVDPCGEVEFPCPAGLICQMGLCVDPVCVGVTCGENQLCYPKTAVDGKTGVCSGGCEGVRCPDGLVCHLGRCVDLCKDLTCPADRVCSGGACVPKCECLACEVGKACQKSTGKCLPDGCESATCAAGQVCRAGSGGTCIDGCTDVVCPVDQMCTMGECVDLPRGAGGTGGSGGGTGPITGTGGRATGGRGGSSAPDGGTAGPDAAAGGAPMRKPPMSCKCELEGGQPGLGLLGAGAGLLALCLNRRRRRRP